MARSLRVLLISLVALFVLVLLARSPVGIAHRRGPLPPAAVSGAAVAYGPEGGGMRSPNASGGTPVAEREQADVKGEGRQTLGASPSPAASTPAAALGPEPVLAASGDKCTLRVKKEFEIAMTAKEEAHRQELMKAMDQVIAPAVAKLRPAGLYAVVMDCVETFQYLCENSVWSMAKLKIKGAVILVTNPKMCEGLRDALAANDGFCLDQTVPVNMALTYIMDGQFDGYLCKTERNKLFRFEDQNGYYTSNHGALAQLQMTRSFAWHAFTKAGVGVLAIDADVAFLRNPFNHYLDRSKFQLEVSHAIANKKFLSHPTAGYECNVAKGVGNMLRDENGEKSHCTATPPPYFGAPESSWWFERHTYLSTICQSDVQTDTTSELDDFFPDVRLTKGPDTLFAKHAIKPHTISHHGDTEYRGSLNLSKFEPLPAGCDSVVKASAIRYLPMDFAIEKCSHSSAVDEKSDNGIVVALHANCAVGVKGTLRQRVISKAQWLRDSGLWFGDPIPDE